MIIGTATALGVAISSDRARSARGSSLGVGFGPALALPQSVARSGAAATAVLDALKPRDFLAKQLAWAAAATLLVFAAVTALPAISAFASGLSAPSRGAPGWQQPAPASAEPPKTDLAHLWADHSQSMGIDANVEFGKGLAKIARDQYNWAVLYAMRSIADERTAADDQAAAAARRAVAPAAPPYTLGSQSGYAPGTVLRARITIYGCTGPGGGFCDHMASGGDAFEGAAACSADLPFGTRLKIEGDPTGRIYECLDRGQLPATWIDVYFSDTTDGMAWQSTLGGTIGSITIVN